MIVFLGPYFLKNGFLRPWWKSKLYNKMNQNIGDCHWWQHLGFRGLTGFQCNHLFAKESSKEWMLYTETLQQELKSTSSSKSEFEYRRNVKIYKSLLAFLKSQKPHSRNKISHFLEPKTLYAQKILIETLMFGGRELHGIMRLKNDVKQNQKYWELLDNSDSDANNEMESLSLKNVPGRNEFPIWTLAKRIKCKKIEKQNFEKREDENFLTFFLSEFWTSLGVILLERTLLYNFQAFDRNLEQGNQIMQSLGTFEFEARKNQNWLLFLEPFDYQKSDIGNESIDSKKCPCTIFEPSIDSLIKVGIKTVKTEKECVWIFERN